MKENYIEKYLHELIQTTIQTVGMDLLLKADQSGINMSYNFIGNYVTFDANRILEAINESQQRLFSLEDYVITITLHELGHAIDRNALQASLPRTLEIFDMKENYTWEEQCNNEPLLAMILEEHEMNIDFEETAWNNAEKLNAQLHLINEMTFESIKKHSLSTYENLYQEDLQLYNELHNNLQPA